MTMQRGSCCL